MACDTLDGPDRAGMGRTPERNHFTGAERSQAIEKRV